jgi:hypothetical protein
MNPLSAPGGAGLILVLATPLVAAHALVGQWSLDLPTQEAGWLEVREAGGKLSADLMWAVGSARPIDSVELREDALVFSRAIRRPLAPKGEPAKKYRIAMRAEGDRLRCTMQTEKENAGVEFFGKRQPPLPARPDLRKVNYGPAQTLFNGRDLTGWRVSHPAKRNGWSVREGVLCNDTPKTDFGAYGEYANLRTEAVFEDFRLELEYRLPAGTGGNSGIYLRGLYEVQVTHHNSKMQGIQGPGAIFGRVGPTHNAGRPAGEWEKIEITLVDRHVTVVLNGERVIDNQPVAGCTGGALQSDVTAPGPIYLQGDHTAVQYRNLILYPVLPAAGAGQR